MLLRGRVKLFYSETDPPLLFDLEADPDELSNLANEPHHAATLSELVSAARDLWDARSLRSRIIKDQDRRRLIHRSHQMGKPPDWDYQPFTDATRQYVRAGKWTVEVEADAHLGGRDSVSDDP